MVRRVWFPLLPYTVWRAEWGKGGIFSPSPSGITVWMQRWVNNCPHSMEFIIINFEKRQTSFIYMIFLLYNILSPVNKLFSCVKELSLYTYSVIFKKLVIIFIRFFQKMYTVFPYFIKIFQKTVRECFFKICYKKPYRIFSENYH